MCRVVLLRVAWVERERQIVGEGVDGCGRWANPWSKPGALHRVKYFLAYFLYSNTHCFSHLIIFFTCISKEV